MRGRKMGIMVAGAILVAAIWYPDYASSNDDCEPAVTEVPHVTVHDPFLLRENGQFLRLVNYLDASTDAPGQHLEFSFDILYDDLDPSGSGDGEDGDDEGSGEVPCEIEEDDLDRAELWHEEQLVAVVNSTGNSTLFPPLTPEMCTFGLSRTLDDTADLYFHIPPPLELQGRLKGVVHSVNGHEGEAGTYLYGFQKCSTYYDAKYESSECLIRLNGGCSDSDGTTELGTLFPEPYKCALGVYSSYTNTFLEMSEGCTSCPDPGGLPNHSSFPYILAEVEIMVDDLTPKMLTARMEILHGAEPVEDVENLTVDDREVLHSYQWIEALDQYDTFGCSDWRPFCADRANSGPLSTTPQPPLPNGAILDVWTLCDVQGDIVNAPSDCRSEILPSNEEETLSLELYCPQGCDTKWSSNNSDISMTTKTLKCGAESLYWEEEEDLIGNWFTCGCEATSFELESFQFYWKDPEANSDEYEGPYIDASIYFHSDQYLRFHYVLTGGIEELKTILIYMSPYDSQGSNTFEIVASYTHLSGIIEYFYPFSDSNSEFVVNLDEGVGDLIFMQPTAYMEGSYSLEIKTNFGKTLNSDLISLAVLSECTVPYVAASHVEGECNVTFELGCLPPQGMLYPQPSVFSLTLESDLDAEFGQGFSPEQGPEDPTFGTFSYGSVAHLTIDDRTPKMVNFTYLMVHGPKDADSQDQLAFVADGKENFPRFDTNGCASWVSYCSGTTTETPYMPGLDPETDLADPNIRCHLRDYNYYKSHCRLELLPPQDKEVSILTFECVESCQIVWPEGVGDGLLSKEFLCRSSSLIWEDAAEELINIWPTCDCPDPTSTSTSTATATTTTNSITSPSSASEATSDTGTTDTTEGCGCVPFNGTKSLIISLLLFILLYHSVC